MKTQSELEHPSVTLLDQIETLVNKETDPEDRTLIQVRHKLRLVSAFQSNMPSK